MLSNPIVFELILEGKTPSAAAAQYQKAVKNFEVAFGTGRMHTFGTIRICPPLKVAQRFRAFVTWLPVAGDSDEA